ncbi:MAG: hypothetical protein WBR18_15710 [Anaerolineales bacterium]
MHSLPYNLELAQAIINQLEPYLLSNEVFWPLGGKSSDGDVFPRGSLGQLLLTLDELSVLAEEMDPAQITTYHGQQTAFKNYRQEHPAILEAKAWAEVDQRLNLWRSLLRDIREGERGTGSYRTDVRQRFLLTRLQTFLTNEQKLRKLHSELSQLDGVLRARFESGEFQWHPRLRYLYNHDDYWFLYGHPAAAS